MIQSNPSAMGSEERHEPKGEMTVDQKNNPMEK